MYVLPDLHDGFFDGLCLSDDKRAHLFVRTVTGERSTFALKGVDALNFNHLKAGNIIFDVVLSSPNDLTDSAVTEAYEPATSHELENLSKRAKQQGLHLLTFNPSYGAQGVVLFRSMEVVPGHVLPTAVAE